MLRRDCRQRLGLTVAGALASDRKPYGSRVQTTLPCAEAIFACSIVPRKPRAASSKSAVSLNGNASSIASCCASTQGEAGFGVSDSTFCGWLVLASVIFVVLPPVLEDI